MINEDEFLMLQKSRFKSLDEDHDGTLSPREQSHAPALFQKPDKKNDH